jgi:hypothetical protein
MAGRADAINDRARQRCLRRGGENLLVLDETTKLSKPADGWVVGEFAQRFGMSEGCLSGYDRAIQGGVTMLRFTIRDMLWLTLVAGLTLGWWCWGRSTSMPAEGFVQGKVFVSGKPIGSGRAFLHSADGQFRGTQIDKGVFELKGVPYGNYWLTFEGDNAPPNKFSAELNDKCQALAGTFMLGPNSAAAGSPTANSTTIAPTAARESDP